MNFFSAGKRALSCLIVRALLSLNSVFNVITMLEYWYAFPFAIFVSTFAMVTGGEGAILFTPFFIAIGLAPQYAIGTAFITQLFGKTSGTIGYMRQGGIRWKTTFLLVLIGIPAIIAGSFLMYALKSALLQFSFGILTIIISSIMFYSLREPDNTNEKVKNKELLRWAWVPGIASFLTGILAIGAGTINMVLLERVLKLKIHKAVATVVATLAFTAAAGALVHAFSGGVRWDLAIFTISGVLIGGQLGPRLAHKMRPKWIKALFAVLTIIVGFTMCITSHVFQ